MTSICQKYKRQLLHLALTISLSTVVLVQASCVQAAATVTIAPPFKEVVIAKDQAKSSFELLVQNGTNVVQTFRLTVRDFGALDESGGVAFLGTSGTSADNKYGLASWLQLGADTVTIGPGNSAKVAVTIDNRESLSPGGHYGAILLTTQGEPGANSNPQVVVTQVLSSLVLVNKQGGENYQLLLNRVDNNSTSWHLPAKIKLRFQNAGNVHVVPRGTVEVKDPTGRLVLRSIINPESGTILPESFRQYQGTLTKVGSAWLPGRYQLQVKYRYDGQNHFELYSQSFYYLGRIGLVIITGLALGLIGLIMLVILKAKKSSSKPVKKP